MLVEGVVERKGRQVWTVAPDSTIGRAIQDLEQHRVSLLVVCDPAGRIVGVLSDRDVVDALADLGADALTVTVGERMTRVVMACRPHDTVMAALRMMAANHIQHLPVVEQGRLAGLVSRGDLMAALAVERPANSFLSPILARPAPVRRVTEAAGIGLS